MLGDRDRRRPPERRRIDDRDHGRQHRPLVDVGGGHVHERHAGLAAASRPVGRAGELGKLGQERRHPLHEHELGDAERRREPDHAAEERRRGEIEHQAAGGEQPQDPGRARAGGQQHDRLRHQSEIRDLLLLARRDAVEHQQVGQVDREQHGGVRAVQRSLDDDPAEVEQRRHQAHHLDRVLPVELDRAPEAGLAARAPGQGVDGPDHRPAEAGQQPQRAGEVRGHQRDVALPGDHRLDRELGQHLDPREHRERQPLGDVELSGLGAPRHHERAGEDGRERPQRVECTAPGFLGRHGIEHAFLERRGGRRRGPLARKASRESWLQAGADSVRAPMRASRGAVRAAPVRGGDGSS